MEPAKKRPGQQKNIGNQQHGLGEIDSACFSKWQVLSPPIFGVNGHTFTFSHGRKYTEDEGLQIFRKGHQEEHLGGPRKMVSKSGPLGKGMFGEVVGGPFLDGFGEAEGAPFKQYGNSAFMLLLKVVWNRANWNDAMFFLGGLRCHEGFF